MTLVELLVVVTIAVLLLAAAVPMMKPALRESQIREAARQINAFVTVAKARAAENGRNAAIWIERSPQEPNAAFEIFLAESPPPYAGDLIGAKAWLFDFDGDGAAETARFRSGQVASMTSLVNAGDTVRFDYKGPSYVIAPPGPVFASPQVLQFTFARANAPSPRPISEDLNVNGVLDSGEDTNGNGLLDGAPVPFQIFRAPVRSSTAPLQLSGGVVVDLSYSGMATLGREFRVGAPYPVVIVFNPSGAVEEVTISEDSNGNGVLDAGEDTNGNGQIDVLFRPPSGTIHLLIGRLDGFEDVGPTPETPNPINWSASVNTSELYSKNIADPANIWVSIGHRTGTVTSVENGWVLTPGPPWPPGPYFVDSLMKAREFARSRQTMGGR